MNAFIPEIEGTLPIQAAPARFLDALRSRVRAGLLTGRPGPRQNYAEEDAGPASMRVRAIDWWTAIAVGLNDVLLDVSEPGVVGYRVGYWRWTLYGVGLCGVIGIAAFAGLRWLLANNPRALIPGLTVEQNLAIAFAMAAFWGFVWPWILVAKHKQPLREGLTRLIAESDAAA